MRPFAVELDESLAEGFSRQMMALARAGNVREESIHLLGRAARAVSRATSLGHVCLMLRELLGIDDETTLQSARGLLFESHLVAKELAQTPLPLVLDSEDRLYLGRYFDYERRLAAMLMARTTAATGSVDEVDAERLGRVFQNRPVDKGGQVDWQKLAVAMALRSRLTIITGGPGTGKTTTVVNLLACLLAKDPTLRIALAAPTGKAAQRMQDAIRERAGHLPEELRSLLPNEAFTIHRLLGVIPDSHRFRHHAENLLALDVLIIDEASMLDLALATKLVAAVPAEAKLILLGDKDQLAAVEAGAVFGEICNDPSISEPCRQHLAKLTGIAEDFILPPVVNERSPLPDAVIWLTENYRFGAYSGIGQLARAINNQDAAAALACLSCDQDNGVRFVEDGGAHLGLDSLAELAAGFDDYRLSVSEQGHNPATVFEAWSRFRILCAVRDSERGVEWLNNSMALNFRQRLNHALDDGRTHWYPGRPVMILRNDYVLKLFNGDIGIILPTADGKLMAYFPTNDSTQTRCCPDKTRLEAPPPLTGGGWGVGEGETYRAAAIPPILTRPPSDLSGDSVQYPLEGYLTESRQGGGDSVKSLLLSDKDSVQSPLVSDGGSVKSLLLSDKGFRVLDPVRLPPHETAFAMTVHKSQGSEFEQVAFVLPAYASTVLTKELIYTGVTRTRRQVTLYSSASVLGEAIARQCLRHSGLISRIRSE